MTILIIVIFTIIGCGNPQLDLRNKSVQPVNNKQIIPANYHIAINDELEIFYYIDSDYKGKKYLIDTEDRLRIEFYYYPVLNKTVIVRPDGMITIPRIGDIKAAGMQPQGLADKITSLYRPYLLKPTVTVELIDFNVKIRKLQKAITTTLRGQSRRVIVRPDGKISLVYIKDLYINGLTINEVAELIETRYRKQIKNLKISASLLKPHPNRAYIIGQVDRPNFYELTIPITLSQLIATAGGFTREANTQQVLLISRNRQGGPHAQIYDMDEIIGRGNVRADPIIRQYDVIFVPRTQLSQAAFVVDSLWRFIPFAFTTHYELGQ
jgi:polysaccharide export outer membrane protein